MIRYSYQTDLAQGEWFLSVSLSVSLSLSLSLSPSLPLSLSLSLSPFNPRSMFHPLSLYPFLLSMCLFLSGSPCLSHTPNLSVYLFSFLSAFLVSPYLCQIIFHRVPLSLSLSLCVSLSLSLSLSVYLSVCLSVSLLPSILKSKLVMLLCTQAIEQLLINTRCELYFQFRLCCFS